MRRILQPLGCRGRTGVGLVIVWMAWAIVASLVNRRSPDLASPYFLAPLALILGVVSGHVLAQRVRRDTIVALLVGVCTILFLSVTLTEGPAKGPTGYANANAAIAVQVIALCGLAMEGSERTERVVLWLALGGGVAVIVANSSKAAFAVCIPVLLAVTWVAWRAPRHAGWAASLAALSVTGTAIGVIGLAGLPEWPPTVLAALDPARKSLWSDALALWKAHPVTGAGPGSLAGYSALGSDPDTASAHSSVLQVGSEAGWVGIALFASLLIAALLWMRTGQAGQVVIGTTALSALAVHSFTDHLLDFGPVMVAAGVVVGWASATGPTPAPVVHDCSRDGDLPQEVPEEPGRTAA